MLGQRKIISTRIKRETRQCANEQRPRCNEQDRQREWAFTEVDRCPRSSDDEGPEGDEGELVVDGAPVSSVRTSYSEGKIAPSPLMFSDLPNWHKRQTAVFLIAESTNWTSLTWSIPRSR